MGNGGRTEKNSLLMGFVVILMAKSLSQIQAMSATGQRIVSSMDDVVFSALTGLLLGQHLPYISSVSSWNEVELRSLNFGIPFCCAQPLTCLGVLHSLPAPFHLEQRTVRFGFTGASGAPGCILCAEKLGALTPEMWGERGRRHLPCWVKGCLLLSQQERKEQVGVRKQFFSYCCMSNRASYCFVYPIG